jgi:hypothetical protein
MKIIILIASRLVLAVGASILFALVSSSMAIACPIGTFPGTEAPKSTMKLQMPFLAGEAWTVGGGGSFYGNGLHCNINNDYYATDWNRTNDNNAVVLAVADGTVIDIVSPPCPTVQGYGCYVKVDHGNGYTTLYAHLSAVLVGYDRVRVGAHLGQVGNSELNGGDPHLHLTFRYNNTSYCYNNGQTCPNTEVSSSPQGYKPSPMMTETGPVTLVDGSTYKSINGRVYLPNLRQVDGWASTVIVKNNTDNAALVRFVFRDISGGNPCGGVYALAAQQRYVMTVNCSSTIAVGYVEADQDISVIVTNQKPSPVVRGAHTGVSAAVVWGPFNVPLVIKRGTTLSGLADSDLFIQNATNVAATIQVQLVGAPGYSTYTKSFNLPANGGVRYILKDDSTIPNGWSGSAVVSNGTFAVVSDFFTWDGQTDFAFSGYPPESKTSTWFVPLFMVRRLGLTGLASTPISVQNLTGGGTSINVGEMALICTAEAGSGYSNFTVSNLVSVSDNASYSFNPATDTASFPVDGWYGACRLTVPSAKKVIVLAQIRYPADYNASTYEALRAENIDQKVFFPNIQKRVMGGAATAIVIQNLNTTTTASVTFYYKASCYGFTDVTVGPYTIPAGGSINHNHRLSGPGSGTGQHNLPDGWCGSLRVVSSNQPIDGFGQITNIDSYAGDTIMAYSGVTRP